MKTLDLRPQYIKGPDGEPLDVFITLAEFQSVLDRLEELDDIKTADAFECRTNKEFVPFQQALDEIKKGGELKDIAIKPLTGYKAGVLEGVKDAVE